MPTATFPGRFDSLEKIAQFVKESAVAAGLNEKAVYGVELAVDEACSNIIEHAYGGEDRGKITCSCKQTKDGLRIVLSDKGKPFDPDGVPKPDLESPVQDREPGGLGLFYIQAMMDEVKYRFSPSGNVLIMLKRR